MVINSESLLLHAPIKNMQHLKLKSDGPTTYGLGEAGYDIRIKQDVHFYRTWYGTRWVQVRDRSNVSPYECEPGTFAIASAIEEFDMPVSLMGIVHDKSSWARQGLSVFNTVIENGWKGFLTLELVFHGEGDLFIPAGSGIAQVIFHRTQELASYNGRYQNQSDMPVPAMSAT